MASPLAEVRVERIQHGGGENLETVMADAERTAKGWVGGFASGIAVAQLGQAEWCEILPGRRILVDELGPVARAAVIEFLSSIRVELMLGATVAAAWERSGDEGDPRPAVDANSAEWLEQTVLMRRLRELEAAAEPRDTSRP